MIWGALVTVAFAGLLLAAAGLRGRRINDHPICRRCGADLFSNPLDGDCSFCRRALGAQRTRRGGRHRRPLLSMFGIALVILAVTAGGFRLGLAADPYDWMKPLPAWIVLRIAQSDDFETETAALEELLRRIEADRIGNRRVRAVVSVGLTAQANDAHPWNEVWNKLIEAAWIRKHLTEEQMRVYGRQAFRPRIILPFELPRNGRWECHLALRPQRAGSTIACNAIVDEFQIGEKHVQFSGSLEFVRHDGQFLVGQGFSRARRGPITRRPAQRVIIEPGKYDVRSTWRIRYFIGETYVEESVTVSEELDVLDFEVGSSGWWWTGLRTEVELLATGIRMTTPTVDLHSGNRRGHGTVYWPLTRLAGTFEVYWRTDDGELKVGKFTMPNPTHSSTTLASYNIRLPDGFQPAAVQVILRPVPGSAERHRFLGDRPMEEPVEFLEVISPMQRVRYREVRWR